MEIDLLKSAVTDDQMEMNIMMMEMEMDKFPAIYRADDDNNNNNNNNDAAEFCSTDQTNIASMPHLIDTNNPHHNNVASPSFPRMISSSMSFNGASIITTPAVQETPMPMPPYYLSYPSNSYNNDCTVASSSSKKRYSLAAMRETIFRIAAMQQPIDIEPETVKAPKRKNVKISKDPQSVAARHRRERISEKIRILQRLVPGGTKMDTASMLDEAIHYVKFLKTQVQSLESAAAASRPTGLGFPATLTTENCIPYWKSSSSA